MNIRDIKWTTLQGIAGLVSVLINLPRFLQLYNMVDNLGNSFTQVTLGDILMRVIFLFVFSLCVLQFNSNWKFRYTVNNPFLSSSITVLVNTALFFVTVSLFVVIHQRVIGDLMNDSDKGLLYFVYFIVLFILLFISRILRLQIIRQDDIAEKKLLKHQSLQNELSALKNQINPHFLFNSLNSLNSLIRDNLEATTFVNKLSFMYRYILQSGQQDLVTLKEELKFLESYVYLIKTRYRNRFDIHIDIDDKWLHKDIPTLALQLLVENAVKHNEISESNPLVVKLYIEDEYIIIENPVKPRMTFIDSTGQGLANIDKRYFLLKNKHIIISNENDIFKIKLPLK